MKLKTSLIAHLMSYWNLCPQNDHFMLFLASYSFFLFNFEYFTKKSKKFR
jgi:cytosine/uracil/thiamine/allantoin permease